MKRIVSKQVWFVPKNSWRVWGGGSSANPEKHCIFYAHLSLWKVFPLLKGYSHCKTIAPQNVSAEEAAVNIFFYFIESYVTFSRYAIFCVFNHPRIYQICNVIISINKWDNVLFWIYLLNYNLLIHQTLPIDRCKQGQ